MLDDSVVIKQYQYLYSKVYGVEKYVFHTSERDKKIIENLLSVFGCGETEMLNYLSYVYLTYSTKDLVVLNKKVQFSWIGKKCYTAYCAVENKEGLNYCINQFQSKFKVLKSDLVQDIVALDVIELQQHEENQKKYYPDGAFRLKHCYNNTTLFNPLSPICNSCGQQKDCKLLLRHEYPNIAKKRKIRSIK